jgi:hypothetical protein
VAKGQVLEAVEEIVCQCGSKSDLKWPGDHEKMITTLKFQQWQQSGDCDVKIPYKKSTNIKCFKLPPVCCRDAGCCGWNGRSVWNLKQKQLEVARGV